MKSEKSPTDSNTIVLLVIASAVQAPLIVVVEQTAIKVALVVVQLACLFAIGLISRRQQ